MASLNSVILLGNLTRNPERRSTPNGTYGDRMRTRIPTLAALLLAAAACGQRGDELPPASGEPASVVQQPAALAQAAGTPLIHVWKSPT